MPRSKFLRVLLFVVPLLVVALLWFSARERPRFVTTPVPVQSLALSHDGKLLAFSIENDEIFWGQNGRYHKLPLEYTPGFGVKSPAALQFSRDGSTLMGTGVRLLANKTPAACQWNLAGNRLMWSVTTAYNDDLGGFALAPDGKSLAQRAYKTVKVLDLTQTGTASTASKSRFERVFPALVHKKL